jgi:23S rRNA pseudouridine1911/1915/1917 synthase
MIWMNPISFTVSAEFDGQRVDVFLASHGELGLTRSAVQRLLDDGKVTKNTQHRPEAANSVTLSKSYRVTTGDVITLRIPPPLPGDIKAEDIPLDIVYEDKDIIVINKPRGLVVHPAAGHFGGTLVNALLYYCKGNLSGIGGVERPGIVHRLDKDTSGLMVVAKNDAAHQALSTQLAKRTMERAYHAICLGTIKKEAFTIDLPIGRHPYIRQRMAVRKSELGGGLSPGARQAITHIKILGYLPAHKPRFTVIEARLETGRTHQIRVHMAHIGYPILGDTLYGPEKQPVKTTGQMLHAKRLALVHPSTGEKMLFEIDFPENFYAPIKSVF